MNGAAEPRTPAHPAGASQDHDPADQRRPIRTLLVANRGEIARRVVRTARQMGMRTVAVFSEPDSGAAFVRDADLAVPLTGATAAETYLDAAAILAAAVSTGADAVHPGYGFLAENASFAAACAATKLTFVGPDPASIQAMAVKHSARELAREAGLPVLPAAQVDDTSCAAEAARLGYPLLVKASAGGGGIGMRQVNSAECLADALRAAKAEAQRSFGDSTVYLERLLPAPRHLEIQVVADRYGTVLQLGERECSIQRRHQKVIEETPSPAVSPALRERLGNAAVALTRSLAYVGVGTVEFLLDPRTGEFFFLEMNTRLQVEHAVTEQVYGVDLVRMQLEIAQGHPLGAGVTELPPRGHAIEARLYAEDPSRGFRPAPGTVLHWRHPDREGVRWESALDGPTEVTAFYDPLLAKVVAHGASRDEAAARLGTALGALEVHGPVTNRELLIAVVGAAPFRAGDTRTDFLDRHRELVVANPEPDPVHFAAALACSVAHRRADDRLAPPGWRLLPGAPTGRGRWIGPTGPIHASYRLAAARGDTTLTITEAGRDQEFTLRDLRPDGVLVRAAGVERACRVARYAGGTVWVNDTAGQSRWCELPRFAADWGMAASAASDGEADASPTATMPGTVVAVAVRPGDRVRAGQRLVVLEAMKTEHAAAATVDGVVEHVHVQVGEHVPAGAVLVTVTPVDRLGTNGSSPDGPVTPGRSGRR